MSKASKKRDWLTFDEIAIRDYKNFRWLMFMGVFFVGPLFLYVISPIPGHASVNVALFWIYLLTYFIQLVALCLLFLRGLFHSFVICLSSAISGFLLFSISTFFYFSRAYFIPSGLWVVASWLFLSPFMWWWGKRTLVLNGELKEAIFRAKRIDIEAGTYSPYRVPHDLYQTKWSKFLISSYGLVLTLALIVTGAVSHFVSSRNMDPNHYIATFFAYLLVPTCIYVLSGWFQEWKWLYQLENRPQDVYQRNH